MRALRTMAATMAVALLVSGPALAQRGRSDGNRGTAPRSDGAAARPAQPRDSATVVQQMLGTGRRANPADRGGTGVPTLPGLNSSSLITPRPGVDAFRTDRGTYGTGGRRAPGPSGPSWGGVPVTPAPPSWGGKPIHVSPDRRDHDRDDGRGRRDRWRRERGMLYPAGVYGLPIYGVPYGSVPYGWLPYGVAQPVTDTAAEQTTSPAPTAGIPEGFLRLLVNPRHASVSVDGVAVGTVDDFGGTREQALSAGPHFIRIEAPGYEPVEFEVRVPAGDTISLRRELTPLPAPAPASAPAPTVRKTFYAIPNCYLGDSIPKADSLPAGCRLEDMRVLPPQP